MHTEDIIAIEGINIVTMDTKILMILVVDHKNKHIRCFKGAMECNISKLSIVVPTATDLLHQMISKDYLPGNEDGAAASWCA